jgi:hypothetical protein
MELAFGYLYMAASTSLYFTRRALLHHSLTPRELGTVKTVDCHVSLEPSWVGVGGGGFAHPQQLAWLDEKGNQTGTACPYYEPGNQTVCHNYE